MEDAYQLLPTSAHSASRSRSPSPGPSVSEKRPRSPVPPPPPAPSTWTILYDKRVRMVMLSGFLLAFIDMCYNVVIVLFAYTPLELGGLDRKASDLFPSTD